VCGLIHPPLLKTKNQITTDQKEGKTMFAIKTMNNISETGLSLFGEGFSISDSQESPEAIVVRSAKVDTDEFPKLLAVARAGAGTNNVSTDKATEKGVCVFNTPGANANAVAELAFIGLGMAVRKVAAALEFTKELKGMEDDAEISKMVEGNKKHFAGQELAGKTMGVVGLGKIGVLVANGALNRGMKVIAYEPYPNVDNMHALLHDVEVTQNLNDVISNSDFLSVHVPLLDATRGIINKESMASFKDGGVLMNFSRSGIINVDDLMQMLDYGKIGVSITDFPTAQELKHEKCLCLPHLGASTSEAEENCATMAVEQLKDYLKYGIVRNSVNFPAVGNRPSMGTKTRLVVINRDVPNQISDISKALGNAGINIHSFTNESNGKIGYNIIDLNVDVDATVAADIEAMENVLRVRVISL